MTHSIGHVTVSNQFLMIASPYNGATAAHCGEREPSSHSTQIYFGKRSAQHNSTILPVVELIRSTRLMNHADLRHAIAAVILFGYIDARFARICRETKPRLRMIDFKVSQKTGTLQGRGTWLQ